MADKNINQKSMVFNLPDEWDYEADVVIIGTGTSMYGATKMAEEGLDVVAIDAHSIPGGATGFSAGMAYLPMNKFAQEEGDTKEETLKYLKSINGNTPTPEENIEAYIDHSNPMMEYMTEVLASYGVEPVPHGEEGFGDYHAEIEGGRTDGWRSISWVPASQDIDIYDVTAWRDAYLQAFVDRSGEIMTSTKAVQYVYSTDEKGVPTVHGVIAERNGKKIALKAKRAVVTAAGGFEWNEKLRNSFLPHNIPYASSLNTNDGTALKMTMELGVELTNMSQAYGHLTFKEKAEEQKQDGLPANITFEKNFPRQIIVNEAGRRFMNESGNSHLLNNQLFERRSYGDYGYSNLPAWQIFDRRFVDEIGMKNSMFVGKVDERGVLPYAKEAETLEELAEIIGVDSKGLIEEVRRWNIFCEKGKDSDFHRGEGYVDKMFNRVRDRDTNSSESNLGPIEEGPFYAIEIAPNTLGTCGGPQINAKAQILHVSGNPVRGLYGCGNFTGFGAPGRSVPGAGGMIGPGQVFGFIAAKSILEDVTDEERLTESVSIPVRKIEIQSAEERVRGRVGPDEYLGTSDNAKGGTLVLAVEIIDEQIKDIRVVKSSETIAFADIAMETLKNSIIRTNSLDVDDISGATITSWAYKEAVEDALNQAK